MDILTLDFETFYSRDYSLSKITTEEYIRDPRFEVIGVSVQVNGGEPEWFSGPHDDVAAYLATYPWHSSLAVAHNAMFDMSILSWRFGIRPKKIACTLSMARALHTGETGMSLGALATFYDIGTKGNEVVAAMGKRRGDFTRDELARYGAYCSNDVRLTYRLFCAQLPQLPASEMGLIDLTTRMFSEPVLHINPIVLHTHLQMVRARKATLLSDCGISLDDLMSNDRLAAGLHQMGGDPPMKTSPTTGKQTFAFAKTDEYFKALAEHPDEKVQAIVAARLGVKSTLEETRTERFIGMAQRGPMPVPLRYYAARTGRWGGCLTAETLVTVLGPDGVLDKRIVDVLPGDLVWDGEAFVAHEGVRFSGYGEIIEHDGIRGTPEHVVFTEAGETSLLEAMQKGYAITPAARPEGHMTNYAGVAATARKRVDDVEPVYDILSCGPRRRFVANGKLVHNSDKINLQNLPRTSPLKAGITAPEGFVIVDADSSQIEARVLAWLAGQDDLVDAFARSEDVYKIMASRIYGKNTDAITDSERFVGKTTVLGCIAEGTLVLSARGWIPIEQLTLLDRLWDGVEWVCHQGLMYSGSKETVHTCGISLTPDHKILCGTEWLEAQALTENAGYRSLALATGIEALSSLATYEAPKAGFVRLSSGATAGDRSLQSIFQSSDSTDTHAAQPVRRRRHGRPDTGNIYRHFQTPSTGTASSSDCPAPSPAAIPPHALHTLTTGGEALQFASYGETTGQSFCAMRAPCLDGTTPTDIWTASTTTGGMSRETSGSQPEQRTTETGEASRRCRKKSNTYDIAFCGPRNRFVVMGDEGPVVVHNCGYAMGASRFQTQLQAFGVALSLAECEHIIRTYRTSYHMVPRLWKVGDTALRAMLANHVTPLDQRGIITMASGNRLRLPNGLYITYPNLRLSSNDEYMYDDMRGRSVVPTKIYGGKVVENIVQALARIIIGHQMLAIRKKVHVVMTVHDSVVGLVPEAVAHKAADYVKLCMRKAPEWGADIPLSCEVKIGPTYGDTKKIG